MTVVLGLSVLASLVTLVSMWLLTKRNRLGWLLSIGNQFTWIILSSLTGTYGLYVLSAAMIWIGVRGYKNWGKHEDRN